MFNDLVFYCVAAFAVIMAGVTVFSQHIIRSAFALLGALIGVAALFGMMGAEFLAVIQMMVYVGGVMVLILFAVMLTHKIKDIQVSNRSLPPLPGIIVAFSTLVVLLVGIWRGLPSDTVPVYSSVVSEIGKALVTDYVLPFAVAAVLLLSALIGSVVIARRRDNLATSDGTLSSKSLEEKQ